MFNTWWQALWSSIVGYTFRNLVVQQCTSGAVPANFHSFDLFSCPRLLFFWKPIVVNMLTYSWCSKISNTSYITENPKQHCRHRSDCSSWSDLIWVLTAHFSCNHLFESSEFKLYNHSIPGIIINMIERVDVTVLVEHFNRCPHWFFRRSCSKSYHIY